VISPSILARCKFPSENWIPPKEFLLSLGQPLEPDPREYDDEDESSTSAAASQHTDELVTEELQSKEPLLRWSLPKCDEELQQIRRDGVPKQTQKQTSWAVSVWEQLASGW